MTYAGIEVSQEGGRPVELYTFELALTIYRYTSAEDDQVVGGETFTAIAIKRGRVSQGQESRRSRMVIEMPSTEPLPSRFVNSAPSERADVTIQQFHRGDGSLATVFTGRLKSIAFGDSKSGFVAKLAVEPPITAMSKEIPVFSFSGQCNNVLGDGAGGGPGLCDVDLDDPAFKLSSTASAQTGLAVTVPGAAAYGDGWFDGGTIETSAGLDARMILHQVGDVLTLHIGFPFPIVGELVTIRAGCAHDIETCSVKFNKVDRYQGFAFIPSINPFESDISAVKC